MVIPLSRIDVVIKNLIFFSLKALENFIEMIVESWTYDRLTEEERKKLGRVLYSIQTKRSLKGTYEHRWEILQAIYSSFIMALDYKPIGWRE